MMQLLTMVRCILCAARYTVHSFVRVVVSLSDAARLRYLEAHERAPRLRFCFLAALVLVLPHTAQPGTPTAGS